MTSTKPNATQVQFDFLEDEPDHVAKHPADDSAVAVIEKSALGDDAHTLMEEIVDEVNMEMAWARVKANRGAPGPDGITVEDFPEWFAPRWQDIRRQLLDGTYPSGTGPDVSPSLKPDGGTTRARHSKLARPCDPNSHRASPHADLRSRSSPNRVSVTDLIARRKVQSSRCRRSFAVVAADALTWICRNSSILRPFDNPIA